MTIRISTLDNGLRVVIVRDTLAPVVTTEMNYLAGSDEVQAGFPGTAHAVEHMMFRGSPGLSKDQLAAIAANMGGAFNADTTQSITQYYFVAPSQDLKVALHVQSLRMRGVDLDEAAWANQTTANMLKQFHDIWYAPNNAILVIAGDVDPTATILARMQSILADAVSKGVDHPAQRYPSDRAA